MLPAIGVALNGTSSVLYGTVPELATADQRQRRWPSLCGNDWGWSSVSGTLWAVRRRSRHSCHDVAHPSPGPGDPAIGLAPERFS
jgi:hypothetical protein